jgi:hypothetical protein
VYPPPPLIPRAYPLSLTLTPSPPLSFTPTLSNGVSGIMTLHTGHATGGYSGRVEVAVGSGNSGSGGAVLVVSGETTADATTGNTLHAQRIKT